MVIHKLLAVIGDPISHSLSPLIHQSIYEMEDIDATYLPVRVKRGEVDAFLEAARIFNVIGFNATMPHKQDILPALVDMDENARCFGSANTMKRVSGGFCGYTTDGSGLKRALEEKEISFSGKKILVIGAGGVAPTVTVTAALSGAEKIALLNRSMDHARQVALRTGELTGLLPEVKAMEGAPTTEDAENYDLVINTTPLGMAGFSDFAGFDFLDGLPSTAAVVDLIYHPARTSLLKAAQRRGLRWENGLGMLAWQAFFAHEIWFGALPSPATRDEVVRRLERAVK